MSGSLPFVFVGSVAAFLAVVFVALGLTERKRRQSLQALGRALGLTFRGTDASDVMERLAALPLMKRRRRKIKNVLIGSMDNLDVCVFDYRSHPVAGAGGTRAAPSSAHTVVAAHALEARLPEFIVRPAVPGIGWLLGRLGPRAISLDRHPELSRRVQICGEDEVAVQKVLTPAVVRFLASLPVGTTCIEAKGDQVLVYSARGLCKVDEVEGQIRDAFNLVAALSP